MPTLLDYILKWSGLAMGIAVIVAWFYAYAKTKLRGFAFVALSGVIKFIGIAAFSLLIVATPINLTTLRYTVLPIFNFTSFAILIFGIYTLVKELL